MDEDTGNDQLTRDLEIDVDLIDILDYVGDSVRPIREGLAVRDANHIVCLGYTKTDTLYVHVRGYVLQSSHPRNKPHEVCLKLHKTDHRQWDLTCSCKAGTKRCKHIVACLMQLNKFKTVEYLSCTDATQAWGYSQAEKGALWGAKLVQDLCCIKRPKKITCNNVELEHTILADSFKRLLEAAPLSAISKHRIGRNLNNIDYRSGISFVPENSLYCTPTELNQVLHRENVVTIELDDLPPLQLEFYQNVVKKNLSEIVQIARVTQSQNNKSWMFHRSVRITASYCYSLFTYAANASADWTKRVSQFMNPKNFHTKAMRYGKTTEEKAFSCYCKKRNPNMKKTGFVIDQQHSWLGGSPDGLDCLSKIILEIKCPASGQDHNLDWIIENCSATKKYVKKQENYGEVQYSLNSKHTYYAQVQVNMYILSCSMCDFVVYSLHEDDFIIIEVGFDENYIDVLISRLKPVYFEKILPALAAKKNQTV